MSLQAIAIAAPELGVVKKYKSDQCSKEIGLVYLIVKYQNLVGRKGQVLNFDYVIQQKKSGNIIRN